MLIEVLLYTKDRHKVNVLRLYLVLNVDEVETIKYITVPRTVKFKCWFINITNIEKDSVQQTSILQVVLQ